MKLKGMRPPRLQTASDEHRQASWLELFYDLVFVVAVANLAHRLLEHHDWNAVLSFVALFIPLWWTWASYTFYADRYDTDDLGQRLLAGLQMVAISLMAASISGDKANSMAAFAVAYVFARALLLTMYTRAYRHVPATQELVGGYLKGFGAGGALWLISIWVPDPWRYILWTAGLAIDLVTPYLLREVQKKVPLSASHLPERFGLFTILVLGESIAAVIAALAHQAWEFDPTFGGVIGVLAATSLWWLYFDNQEGSVVRRNKGRRTAWKPTVWIYSHLPLAIGLTAGGIGFEFAVAQERFTSGRWIMIGGVAFALLAMAVIHIATDRGTDALDRLQAIVRVAAVVVLIVIGFISGGWATNVLLIAVLLVNVVQIAIDLRLAVTVDAEAATAH
jgi:low temperature requirement protein LtrA